uniref:flagellar biosynthesis protein FlhA n=1 Tax=Buchnera aphidicola TaxID=9 RepID=UPI003F5CC401
MILPLPSLFLDIFFTFNIILSIMMLLISMFINDVLEFSSFPTMLLFSTLLRLSLNIASTRIILLKGHLGLFSAGHVIESFGNFLVGGDFLIGIIIFIILIIINFIVITKGSERISEVSARFALDGLPGKQISIDSDLNTGSINSDIAKYRRLKILREANFYGAMDGASKFVRGDAIAGILIMVINIFGGLLIGIFKHHMKLIEASTSYTILTIGDGLVAQIPSLMISTAVGVIVTRVDTKKNISEQIFNQIFHNTNVILLTSIIIGILGFIPGMPNLVFLFFTFFLILIFLVIKMSKKNILNKDVMKTNNINNISNSDHYSYNVSWNDVVLEDVIRIEIGSMLISMIDINKKNNLFTLIDLFRRDFAKKIGFLPDSVHVITNLNLSQDFYRIVINGIEYGRGKIFIDHLVAIDMGNVKKNISGKKIIKDIFKMPAVWIPISLKLKAERYQYCIIDPEELIITHFSNIMFENLKDIFRRSELQKLLDYTSTKIPNLVDELIPKIMDLTCLHKVLKNLLMENIPLRDMRTILETLIEYASHNQDSEKLTSLVRLSLSKFITQNLFYNKDTIHVMRFDAELENKILKILESKDIVFDPVFKELLLEKVGNAISYQESMNDPLVLLVRHTIRSFLSVFLRDYFKKLIVLSDLEISDNKNIIVKNMISFSI